MLRLLRSGYGDLHPRRDAGSRPHRRGRHLSGDGRRAASARSESGADNVTIVEAGLLSYSHMGHAPAVVYCRNVLHHLPDFWKGVALQTDRRLPGSERSAARPRHRLRLRACIGARPDRRVARRRIRRPTVGYTAEDLVEHLRSEHSTYRAVLDSLLESAGFRIIDAQFRRSVYASYTCAVGRVSGRGSLDHSSVEVAGAQQVGEPSGSATMRRASTLVTPW